MGFFPLVDAREVIAESGAGSGLEERHACFPDCVMFRQNSFSFRKHDVIRVGFNLLQSYLFRRPVHIPWNGRS